MVEVALLLPDLAVVEPLVEAVVPSVDRLEVDHLQPVLLDVVSPEQEGVAAAEIETGADNVELVKDLVQIKDLVPIMGWVLHLLAEEQHHHLEDYQPFCIYKIHFQGVSVFNRFLILA